MADYAGDNLRRLMVQSGLTVDQVVQKTGLDKRTIMRILDGGNKPQPRTLCRLAEGLGVSADELFVEPAQLLYRRFDRETNPVIKEVVQSHPGLFTDWSEVDFDELHSRFGSGGPLTAEGTLAAVEQMNQKRQLHEKLSLLLETGHAEVIRTILEAIYEKIAVGKP